MYQLGILGKITQYYHVKRMYYGKLCSSQILWEAMKARIISIPNIKINPEKDCDNM